jgi:uncharacterized C2H2 Zn-finger protein
MFTDRETKIETLLLHYQDAIETLDRSGDMAYSGAPGSVCLLMGELWRHPSYQELERTLKRFSSAKPVLWWDVRERYITNTARTVLACPRCDAITEVAAKHFKEREDGTRTVSLKHKHGGEPVFFVLRSIPVLSRAIRPENVEAGVRWIAKSFKGDVFVPDPILGRERSAAA